MRENRGLGSSHCRWEPAREGRPRRATNQIAWFLATTPFLPLRDPARAVELAGKAVEKAPRAERWNTLGVAYYRAGNWKAAIEALEMAETLASDQHLAFDGFFLAMGFWRTDRQGEARRWYDQSVQWMEKNRPGNAELIRFRAEAEEVLNIKAAQEPSC